MKTTWIFLIGMFCLIGTGSAMGSTNYGLDWNTLSGGGGLASSPLYQLQGTIGQIAGHSISINYQIEGGFLAFHIGSPPDTIPPASITNLHNTTYATSSINWAWTDPTDTDFSHVLVYIDNVPKPNVNKGIQYFNATGLTANTDHTISTHTVDSSGNVNSTWGNQTRRTAPSPDTRPPASITNLHNTTYATSYINWAWTDPTDTDFSHVLVYIDNVPKPNVSKGLQSFNATGLTANTDHTISTHTVDSSGNVNSTWGNQTRRTAPSPDTRPPASITNLHNTTYATSSINWAWTDPTDTDFSYVLVYIDNVPKPNVSKGLQSFNATGLTSNANHTFSSRSVDTTGNVNSTWVNQTRKTASGTDTTPPASITNLLNTTYAPTFITWSWTDPTDSDFDLVMVYIDNVKKTNVSKGLQSFNATGLTSNANHTISTSTIDTTGNVNSTWVNQTRKTALGTDITPPASITNLHNTTYATSYINWSWTDPTESDFNRVMVYLDGIWKTNVSKGTRYYLATGLSPDMAYTIGTCTVDTSGNANLTWRTHVARTAAASPKDFGKGVFRPSSWTNWILDRSMDGTTDVRDHYGSSTDKPLIGDFNNDGRADRALFRSGEWIIDYNIDGSINSRPRYGQWGDIPLVGRMDADGTTDRGVFRNGQWILDYSMDGIVNVRNNYGTTGDIPLIGDFNNDGTPDRAVFRGSSWENWIIDLGMNGSTDTRNHFGQAGDLPLIGDFNRDGATDRALFRSGEWIIDYNMDGSVNSRQRYGMTGDIPLVWNL